MAAAPIISPIKCSYVTDDALDEEDFYEIEDLDLDLDEDFATAGVPNPDEVKNVNICDRIRFFRRDDKFFCKTKVGQVIEVDLPKENHDGSHVVDVIDNGKPIPGSPFNIRVRNAINKKKVRAYGRGLKSGLRVSFVPTFRVDTRGAGDEKLIVTVNGPKGFKVNMVRADTNNRIAIIDYRLATDAVSRPMPGIYTLDVKWSGEHIKDSPFEVFIAEDEKALQKYNLNLVK